MKIRKHVIPKIIIALLFPPALFAIQFKSVKELQYMPQTQEEHEQDLEDQESDSDSESEASDKGGERIIDDGEAATRINRDQLLYQRFGEIFKDAREAGPNSSREDSDKLVQRNLLSSEHSLVKRFL